MQIAEIISELANPRQLSGSLEVKRLLIEMAMWMRFPDSAEAQASAVLYARSRYAELSWGDIPINSLAEDQRQFLLSDIYISKLCQSHDPYDVVLPDFEMAEFEGAMCPMNDFDYIANILKFLFWYDPRRNSSHVPNAREIASLNKAYLFMHLNGFGQRMTMTRATFMKRWNRLCGSSAFLYADIFEFDGRFRLNPTHADFAERVDELARDPGTIVEFIGKSLAAVELLHAKLHARARSNLPIAVLPPSVKSLPLTVISLPADIRNRVQHVDFVYDSEKRAEYDDAEYVRFYGPNSLGEAKSE